MAKKKKVVKKKVAKKASNKKKVAKKAVKKVAKKATKKPSNKKKTAKKVVKKAVKKVVKKVAKKAVSVKKAVKKVVKKADKKKATSAPKKVSRKTGEVAKKVEATKNEDLVKTKSTQDSPAAEIAANLVELDYEEEFEEEIVLTDAEGNVICRLADCDQVAQVDGYCRYHYLLFWKKIQSRKKILSEGKLERYIEELTARYPDKFLEVLKKDLRNQKDFLSAIQELEIDEPQDLSDYEEEEQNFIEEIRGVSDSNSMRDEDEY